MRRVMLACLMAAMVLVGGRAWAEPGNADLWGYWPLSGDVNDYSPNQRDGKVVGAVGDGVMQGPFTGAATFSGGRVEVPGTAFDGSFTVAAWVYFDSSPNSFVPLVGRMGVHGRRMELAYQTGGNAEAPAIVSEVGLHWRRWTHVAVVWDAPERALSFWQRGVRVATIHVRPDIAVPPPFSGPFAIGGMADGPAFTGRLAEAMVMSRALSADEMQFLSDGMGRQTPQQLAISSGCGGNGQGPCWVCRRYQAWPPAQWSECAGGKQPWCAATPMASQFATCP